MNRQDPLLLCAGDVSLFLASQLGWLFWCQEMMLSTTSEEVNVWALLDRACLFDEGHMGKIFFFFVESKPLARV